MNDNYSYRKPLDVMNTKDRCRWYADMLTDLLPEGHKETEAFKKAHFWLTVPKVYESVECATDLGFITRVKDNLKQIAGESVNTTEAEEWRILETAVKEILFKKGNNDYDGTQRKDCCSRSYGES